MFVRGNISIVSLLTLFSGRRSAEMPVDRMKKKKRLLGGGGGGGGGNPTFTHQADLFSQ